MLNLSDDLFTTRSQWETPSAEWSDSRTRCSRYPVSWPLRKAVRQPLEQKLTVAHQKQVSCQIEDVCCVCVECDQPSYVKAKKRKSKVASGLA